MLGVFSRLARLDPSISRELSYSLHIWTDTRIQAIGPEPMEYCVKVDILSPGDPDWENTTAAIALVYRKAYGARLTSFMPQLLKVSDQQDSFRAIVGLREAAKEPLFLETYLDEPIEQAIGRVTGEEVAREGIIEIGNLAEFRPGDARLGIIATTRYLHTLGYKWVVFTAVPQLINAFRRLGMEPVEMVEADPVRLPEEQRGIWGSYYDDRPMVCCGNIASGIISLIDFENTWLSAKDAADEQLRKREA